MRIVLQRVNQAQVSVDEKVIGKIGKGYMLLVGFGPDDTEDTLDYMVHKVTNLRVFESEPGKMDLGLTDVNGAILSISQFTLYADVKHGFSKAAKPSLAKPLYEKFNQKLAATGIHVETGEFGADMKVDLENDGPVTILYEK